MKLSKNYTALSIDGISEIKQHIFTNQKIWKDYDYFDVARSLCGRITLGDNSDFITLDEIKNEEARNNLCKSCLKVKLND